jgi:hypothetical protein
MDTGRSTANAMEKLNAFSIGTPHADTGVREIRELINGGKVFAVLTPISLLPQIEARGTNEWEMDEGIAEKVGHMTKIIMAATADAWLIHLPGMARRHEVYIAELLAMDRSNVENLVAIMQDSAEDDEASSRTFSSSFCFLNSTGQEFPIDGLRNSLSCHEAISEPRNSSLLLLYSKEAKIANRKELDRLVWVQTRAQQGDSSRVLKLPQQKRKRKDKGPKEAKVVVGKQRQSLLSSWMGKQLLGQNIPKRRAPGQGRHANDDGGIPAWLACHSVGWLC